MPQLPPEIIDAIICKVDDTATLKSCSLVSSSLFRYPSQRRLFRSLTLNGWATPPNYDTVSTLLDESPHIAAYFTHLSVVLPDEVPSIPDIKSLKRVLNKLSNVRWCMLDGGTLSWTPAFHAPFLRFLARQRSLRELHVDSFSAIPQDVMLELLIAAPGLSFKSTSVDAASRLRCRSPPNWARILSRPVERLAVEERSSSVSEFLNEGQLAKLAGQMRFLSVVFDCEESMRLVHGCAETLEHLRFNGIAESPTSQLNAHFPSLRSVEFVLSSDNLASGWLVDTLQALLRPTLAPRLSRITLTVACAAQPDSPALDAGCLATLASLDAALTSVQPAAEEVRVCWQFDVPEATTSVHMQQLYDCVRKGMPRAREKGRLVFEQFKAEDCDSREGYLYP
ncbi:hypothetical protein FB45DRAFT_1062565 [Roridomyces roridus]|uniref:F-box domain-containing protein n=1 Tax=Roridomyces roridus TaxID=1738132 RepID=A0AAD7BGC4_9AGAR|nr:hypothetical protein FB45DRAFT_1062565 [Roridomyces roridus]